MSKFLGRSELCLTGSAPLSEINRISRNFPVYEVKRLSDKKIIFQTDYKNVGNIFAFIDKTCYTISIVRSFGLQPFLASLHKRVGLYIGAACFIAMITAFSLFLWDVDVTADSDYNTTKVVRDLRGAGLLQPFKAANDEKAIEKYIYLNYADVSYVSCKTSGGRMSIRLVPSLTYEVEAVRESICADVSGMVTKMIVRSGTALVKKGDTVEVGDVLIIGEIAGEKVPAIGTVYVEKMLSASHEVPSVKVRYSRTGNYVEDKILDCLLFKTAVKSANCTYGNYEKVQSFYYPFKDNLLPIKMYVTRYYELTAEYIPTDVEAEKQYITEKVVCDALGVYREEDVSGSETEIAFSDGVYQINVILRVTVKSGGN